MRISVGLIQIYAGLGKHVQISSGLVFRLAQISADCISADNYRLAHINADWFALAQISANSRSVLIDTN